MMSLSATHRAACNDVRAWIAAFASRDAAGERVRYAATRNLEVGMGARRVDELRNVNSADCVAIVLGWLSSELGDVELYYNQHSSCEDCARIVLRCMQALDAICPHLPQIPACSSLIYQANELRTRANHAAAELCDESIPNLFPFLTDLINLIKSIFPMLPPSYLQTICDFKSHKSTFDVELQLEDFVESSEKPAGDDGITFIECARILSGDEIRTAFEQIGSQEEWLLIWQREHNDIREFYESRYNAPIAPS